MAAHSSILAWRIPWTEGPGRVQSMGWQRVRHNWVTDIFTFHVLLGPYVFYSFPSLAPFLYSFFRASWRHHLAAITSRLWLSPSLQTILHWGHLGQEHSGNIFSESLFSSLPILSNSFCYGKPPMLPCFAQCYCWRRSSRRCDHHSWPICGTGVIRGSSPFPLTWAVYATHCSHSGKPAPHSLERTMCHWVYLGIYVTESY